MFRSELLRGPSQVELSRIHRSQNPRLLEVRFRATLGQEPEIELMLV
jgi:hypothetical protein